MHALAVALVAVVTAALPPPGAATHGVAVNIPPGWRAAQESLTPQLLDPRELFSVGTYPLRYRQERCSHMPSSALADLGPTDAFVTLQERGRAPGASWAGFPPRPASFAPTRPEATDAAECIPGSTYATYWRPFTEGGRHFYALVVFGRDASATTRAQAWQILDGMEIDPRVQPDWDSSP